MEISSNIELDNQIEPMFMIIKTESRRSRQYLNKKRAYQHVDLCKRKELVYCISQRIETMKDCAKRLNINYCTAKHIMKVYRRTGFVETDTMRKKQEKDEELKIKVLNDVQFSDFSGSNSVESTPKNKERKYSNELNEFNSSESTHNSGSEITFDNVESESVPTFIFNQELANSLCDVNNFKPQMGLENLCVFLGNLVYSKHNTYFEQNF